MQQCPLFGRRPLLRVSVNRELTVFPVHLRLKLIRSISYSYSDELSNAFVVVTL